MPAKAILISIGAEILYGQTLDTNSHWISRELDSLGIRVIKKVTIGDSKEEILSHLKEAENVADIVLMTGGLGPTSDDLTKSCLVEYFDTYLLRNNEILKHIQLLFAKVGREMTELNEQQADFPSNCTVVPNVIGTASGMWFEKKEKIIISMPGVPYEMKRMMEDTILPKLKSIFIKDGIYHRMIRTVGIPESKLAEKIKDWEKSLPDHIKLAYLPTIGSVELRLTTFDNTEKVQNEVQNEIDRIVPQIKKYVYGFDDDKLEQVIGRLLKNKKYKLAIAESCTGGFASHKITSVSGSSEWFIGSIVTYSDRLKNEQLYVDNKVILEHGAVSEPVVLILAENIRKKFKTDVGVSISGIAGPSGGTHEKPVGTVWIGYSDNTKTVAKKFQFTKGRDLNIQYSVVAALDMIRINLNR